MADIDIDNTQQAPGGIVTFEMIFRAINKLIARMNKVEERLNKLDLKKEAKKERDKGGEEINARRFNSK